MTNSTSPWQDPKNAHSLSDITPPKQKYGEQKVRVEENSCFNR